MKDMSDVEVPKPIGMRKVRDKFGGHRVFTYSGLDWLTYFMSVRISQQEKKQDSVYMVSGLEGTGKSMFTLWNLDIYKELTGQEIHISHVTRTLNELFLTIYNLKTQPSCLTLDEGSELSGENTMTKEVKKTKKKFTVMRKCSHIIFLCFINPLRITTYFREDRVRGLFFVVKPGEVWFYSNNQANPHLANILDSWSKEHEAKSLKFLLKYAPDVILTGIPDYHGYLREEYESRKDDNIFDVLKEGIKQDELPMESSAEWFDIDKAAQYLGIGNATLRNYIREGKFNTFKLKRRHHISKVELDNYKGTT